MGAVVRRPADDKPFARVAAAGVLAHTLMDIDPRFPKVSKEARERSRRESRARGPRRPRASPPIRSSERRQAGQAKKPEKKGKKA